MPFLPPLCLQGSLGLYWGVFQGVGGFINRWQHSFFELCSSCRDMLASSTTAAFVASCMHAIVLPYQWFLPPGAKPRQGVPGSYAFLAPLQLLFNFPSPMQARRVLLRDLMLLAVLLNSLGASFVYPMDWGREYQAWPIPTVYGALASFGAVQIVELLWSLVQWMHAAQQPSR